MKILKPQLSTSDLEMPNRVIVTVYVKVMDSNYTQLFHVNGDLGLRTAFLPDQVQKLFRKVILVNLSQGI